MHDPAADLWKTDTDACCHIRKVLPLDAALDGFDGLDHRPQALPWRRAMRLPVVEEAEGKLKFNPLANWTKAELDAYAAEHDLPAHPLVRVRLSLDRLLALHRPVEDGRRHPRRPLGGLAKDRMRHPPRARAPPAPKWAGTSRTRPVVAPPGMLPER